jgi:hypothetical protein
VKTFAIGVLSAAAILLCGAALQDANNRPAPEYEHIYVDPENHTMHLFTEWAETPIPKEPGVFVDTVAKLQKNDWRVVAMDDTGFIMRRNK